MSSERRPEGQTTRMVRCLLAFAEDAPDRERALQEFVFEARRWGATFVLRQFAGEWRRWAAQDVSDVIDEVVQELAVAVARGKASRLRSRDPSAILAWCRSVVRNAVIGELGRRRRRSSAPPPAVVPDAEADDVAATREAFVRLVLLLRLEVEAMGSASRASQRLGLFDDFLAHLLDPVDTQQSRKEANRRSQRHARGSSLARRGFQRLRSRARLSPALEDVASALGLVRERPR